MNADLITIVLLMAQLEAELGQCDDEELDYLVRSGIIGEAMANWIKMDYQRRMH